MSFLNVGFVSIDCSLSKLLLGINNGPAIVVNRRNKKPPTLYKGFLVGAVGERPQSQFCAGGAFLLAGMPLFTGVGLGCGRTGGLCGTPFFTRGSILNSCILKGTPVRCSRERVLLHVHLSERCLRSRWLTTPSVCNDVIHIHFLLRPQLILRPLAAIGDHQGISLALSKLPFLCLASSALTHCTPVALTSVPRLPR